jgi:hypothetical protein
MWKSALQIAGQIKLASGGPLRIGIMYVGGDNRSNQFKAAVLLSLTAGSQSAAVVSFD